jgi:hypothetical protein
VIVPSIPVVAVADGVEVADAVALPVAVAVGVLVNVATAVFVLVAVAVPVTLAATVGVVEATGVFVSVATAEGVIEATLVEVVDAPGVDDEMTAVPVGVRVEVAVVTAVGVRVTVDVVTPTVGVRVTADGVVVPAGPVGVPAGTVPVAFTVRDACAVPVAAAVFVTTGERVASAVRVIAAVPVTPIVGSCIAVLYGGGSWPPRPASAVVLIARKSSESAAMPAVISAMMRGVIRDRMIPHPHTLCCPRHPVPSGGAYSEARVRTRAPSLNHHTPAGALRTYSSARRCTRAIAVNSQDFDPMS